MPSTHSTKHPLATPSCWTLLKKAALICSIIFISVTYAAPTKDDALVSTPDQGSFAGLVIDDWVEGYFGLPYAEPPIGHLRFRQTKPSWPYTKQDIRDASKPGASCLQPPRQVQQNNTSEDCLFLNIYRPRSSTFRLSIPVMVYIHGGAWAVGSGSLPFFNGTALVHRSLDLLEPVIVVTINYRLGAFGFLGGAAMQQADREGTAVLNAGLHDIRESLRWLRQNVASFGGDPHRITIWGNSAGGQAVAAQLLANKGQTEGLFDRAILQSGSQATWPRFNASDAYPSKIFDVVAQAAGCEGAADPLNCLRQVDGTRLSQASTAASNKFLIFSPVLDEYFVQEPPSSQLQKGLFNQSIPCLHTVNLDEGTQITSSIIRSGIAMTSDSDFAAGAALLWGDSVQSIMPDILRLYPNDPSLGQPHRPYYWGSSPNDTFFPPGKDGSINQYKRLASFAGDASFYAGARQHIYAATKFKVPTWALRFGQPTPENSSFAQFQDSASLGVQHASEIPYVFGNKPFAVDISKQPEALRPFITNDIIERTMKDVTAYFINFAAHGDPNRIGHLHWPQYGSAVPGKELILQPEGIKIQDDDQHLEQIDFILQHPNEFHL